MAEREIPLNYFRGDGIVVYRLGRQRLEFSTIDDFWDTICDDIPNSRCVHDTNLDGESLIAIGNRIQIWDPLYGFTNLIKVNRIASTNYVNVTVDDYVTVRCIATAMYENADGVVIPMTEAEGFPVYEAGFTQFLKPTSHRQPTVYYQDMVSKLLMRSRDEFTMRMLNRFTLVTDPNNRYRIITNIAVRDHELKEYRVTGSKECLIAMEYMLKTCNIIPTKRARFYTPENLPRYTMSWSLDAVPSNPDFTFVPGQSGPERFNPIEKEITDVRLVTSRTDVFYTFITESHGVAVDGVRFAI